MHVSDLKLKILSNKIETTTTTKTRDPLKCQSNWEKVQSEPEKPNKKKQQSNK